MVEKVILVSKKDKKIGEEEKLKAHIEGKLHRAISVFIFNKKGEILLQKRAKTKYHSPNLWANTCCSHPKPGEKAISTAKRRLKEEMGIEATLKKIGKIYYQARVGNLIEREIDHIFVGFFEGNPKINPKEVEEWKWMHFEKFVKDVKTNSQKYAPWVKIILEKVNFKNIK